MKRHTSAPYSPTAIATEINEFLGGQYITAREIHDQAAVTFTRRIWNEEKNKSIIFHTTNQLRQPRFIKLTLYTYSPKGVKRLPNTVTYIT